MNFYHVPLNLVLGYGLGPPGFMLLTSVVRPTILYITSQTVIPAPISIGVNSSGNSTQKHWILPYQVRGKLSQARNDKQSKGTFDALY